MNIMSIVLLGILANSTTLSNILINKPSSKDKKRVSNELIHSILSFKRLYLLELAQFSIVESVAEVSKGHPLHLSG